LHKRKSSSQQAQQKMGLQYEQIFTRLSQLAHMTILPGLHSIAGIAEAGNGETGKGEDFFLAAALQNVLLHVL
jgi:hypothetical protein